MKNGPWCRNNFARKCSAGAALLCLPQQEGHYGRIPTANQRFGYRPRVMPLKSVTFERETDIRYEFQLETSDEKRPSWCILLAKFSGHYRPGHRGAPDARFIQGITQAAVGVWCPAALILDFRNLDYVWGDEMEEVLGCRGEIRSLPYVIRWLPYAVVLGDQCRPAITTLLQVFRPEIASATELEHFFDDIEEAWKYVHQKA